MPFAVGDRVVLEAHVGGKEGFVVERVGGPKDYLYRVQGRTRDPRRVPHTVAEVDIASGPGAVPIFTVGRAVTIDGFSGTVVTDNGDGTYEIDVTVHWNEHLTTTRRHSVPGWQIAIWSAEG